MMGFVMDDRKVEENWKFCTRTRLLLSLLALDSDQFQWHFHEFEADY